MEEPSTRETMNRLQARFGRLYGDSGAACMKRLKLLVGRYEELAALAPEQRWTQADNVLITYGDSVRSENEPPLATLARFAEEHLVGVIDTIHLLPFFPWSSDDGFSVIDYCNVDPPLGTWDDVHALGCRFRLMFDLVLNHCSTRSSWFRDYVTGVAPARYYFHEVQPGTDLSAVVRPRPTPLLTPVETRSGERWVWTTFSSDQVDLNFANPDLLFEFIDVLLNYVCQGARIIRLDAVAYLWKRVGTPCIHLPETHEVVKLLRDVLELVAPGTLLLTETNVPHPENVSYFGEGDEAHIVYNFSLPPLLLHALRSGSAKHLTRWAAGLGEPPPGCTYLNFTASHDGIGVRPLEGILTPDQIDDLCGEMRELGGQVSERTHPDGSHSPYELNITYFSAMARSDEDDYARQIDRFLCSQTIALALRGIPAIYIHSLTATENDHEAVENRGYPRAINRHKWDLRRLDAQLANPAAPQARVFEEYRRRLLIRTRQPAFHPDGPQRVLPLSDAAFAIERTAPDGEQTLLSISNVSDEPIEVKLTDADTKLAGQRCRDLLEEGDGVLPDIREIRLAPYQTRWLTPSDSSRT